MEWEAKLVSGLSLSLLLDPLSIVSWVTYLAAGHSLELLVWFFFWMKCNYIHRGAQLRILPNKVVLD